MAIERTLVLIRERPMLDLFDLSLVVVRKRPVTLGLAALLGVAPFYLFNLWLFDQVPENLALFLAWTVWMIEAPLAAAPLTMVLGGLMFGQKPTVGKVLGSLFKASFGLIAVYGVLRFLLFFFIPTRLAFASEILLLERGKWWKIVGRGGDLSSGRSGELVLIGLLQLFLTYLFAVVFFVGVTQISQLLLGERISYQLPDETTSFSWRLQLPIWIVVSFFAIVRFLTYIDQRIRLEGWEVELRLREVGEALVEARRW